MIRDRLCYSRRLASLFTFSQKFFYSADKWAIKTGRLDLLEKSATFLQNCFVCASHFEITAFTNTLNDGDRRRLKASVLPTILNVHAQKGKHSPSDMDGRSTIHRS